MNRQRITLKIYGRTDPAAELRRRFKPKRQLRKTFAASGVDTSPRRLEVET